MKYLDKKEQILLSDNHVLIAYKPAGLITQSENDQSYGLDTFVKNWIKEKFSKPGAVFAHPIHRLDKPVSGLVIFARTSKALSRLQEMMRENLIVREYLAIIEGTLTRDDKGKLEDYILRQEHRARIISSQKETGVKIASLFYEKVEEKEGKTLLRVILQTGRYHQIRAQLAHHFGPIVGDKRYGSAYDGDGKKIFLHNCKVAFTHPIRQTPYQFEIDAPFDL